MHLRHLAEQLNTRYYRSHPLHALQFIYSKYLFSRARIASASEMLTILGLDDQTALSGLDRWMPNLNTMLDQVQEVRRQGAASREAGILLYGITRALKPDVIIETGVAAGVSTSFILAALAESGSGTLYSIELPQQDVASRVHDDGAALTWDLRGVGWAIPRALGPTRRQRHELILEDVRSALPRVVKDVGTVDVFIHDDLHTPDHMLWEFDLVWPHMPSGGVMVADDVNQSWIRFCRRENLVPDGLANVLKTAAVRKP